jgi:hypothetical protein
LPVRLGVFLPVQGLALAADPAQKAAQVGVAACHCQFQMYVGEMAKNTF